MEYYKTLSKYKITNDAREKKILTKELKKFGKNYACEILRRAESTGPEIKCSKRKRALLRTARNGYPCPYIENCDSFLLSRPHFAARFENKYRKFLSKDCDITTSVSIIKLFQSDQDVRNFNHFYTNKDTAYKKLRIEQMIAVDSANYYALMEIMKAPTFDATKLLREARLGIILILTHSSTNRYEPNDTVFAFLRQLMEDGTISNEFYATIYDRYYMYAFHLNYYCNFYGQQLPVFDIENVDRRRAEIGLVPLYYEFKFRNKLDKLPKDYLYDPDSNTKK